MHPYLVSASPENLRTTLLTSVSLNDVAPVLTSGQLQYLTELTVSGAELSFIITAGEVRRAKTDSRFVLQVVTAVLSDRVKSHKYTGADFNEQFALVELAYKASIHPSQTS